jgi:uracil-DNA glycosylase
MIKSKAPIKTTLSIAKHSTTHSTIQLFATNNQDDSNMTNDELDNTHTVNDNDDENEDYYNYDDDDDDDDNYIYNCNMKVKIDVLIESMQQSLTDQFWAEALHDEFKSDYFRQLATVLVQEGYHDATFNNNKKTIIYPPLHDIFTALNECSLPDVKVIILGKSPYHGPRQAHGLAFSIPLPKQQQGPGRSQQIIKVPPSLRNILREVIDDIGIDVPSHGNLLRWSRQGVLLLITVLTVRHGEPNSHDNIGWEQFTDAIIQCAQVYQFRQRQLQYQYGTGSGSGNDDEVDGVVYLLWGNTAATKIDAILNIVSRPSKRISDPISYFKSSRCNKNKNTVYWIKLF